MGPRPRTGWVQSFSATRRNPAGSSSALTRWRGAVHGGSRCPTHPRASGAVVTHCWEELLLLEEPGRLSDGWVASRKGPLLLTTPSFEGQLLCCTCKRADS